MNSPEKNKSARSPYWDIVKGLGIITIVLGHSRPSPFVYLFHLALFFFITGYFFNETKYGDSPFLYFGVRLQGSWPKYFFYTSIFVLMHNFFVTRGLYAGQELYNHTMMLTAAASGISFTSPEPVQGALWFVPVWLVSSAIFCGTVWFGRMLSRQFNKPALKMWLSGFAALFVGLAGVFLNMRQCALPYNLQTALLVVPLYFIAWCLKLYLQNMKNYFVWYGCLISAVLLYLINNRLNIFIELASMNIPGLWFYPISLLGIYFVLSLAAMAEKLPFLSGLLTFLGRHSFDIMALHFTVFKLIDYVYARYLLQEIPDNLARIPVSFTDELVPVYLIIGTLVPAGIGFLVNRIVRLWYELPARRAQS